MAATKDSIKAHARHLVEQLPDIEAGLKDVEEGRTLTTAEVRKRLEPIA